MKIEIDQSEVVHILNEHNESNPLLKLILEKVNHIMATQAELAAALKTANDALTAIATEVDKVGTEVDTLNAAINNLTAIISAGGATTPEVDAALKALQTSVDSITAKVKAVDDKVPDAPVTP